MKCIKCGTELPDHVSYCDNCGSKVEIQEYYREKRLQKEKKDYRVIVGVALAILVFAVAILIISEDTKYDRTINPAEDIDEINNEVSESVYNTLEYGMTYEEVAEILGGDGVLLSEEPEDGIYEFAWPGANRKKNGWNEYELPQVVVGFEDWTKKAVHIEELNIIDGEEVFKNNDYDLYSQSKITKEDKEKAKEAESYDELVQILGVEGTLMKSKSTKDGSIEKKYRWSYSEPNKDGKLEDHVWDVNVIDGKVQK